MKNFIMNLSSKITKLSTVKMNKLPKTKSKQTPTKNKHFFECIDEAFFNYRNEVTLSRINYINSFNPFFQRALADVLLDEAAKADDLS